MITWHSNPYALALFTCALLTGAVALYAWRHRAAAGIMPTLVLLGATIWTAGNGLALGFYDLPTRILLAKIQHIGIAMIPAPAAILALQYTDASAWVTRRNLILLQIVPFVGLVLAWTNEAHKLIWANMQIATNGPLALLDITYGPYFWLYALYNHLVIAGCGLLFLFGYRRASYLQKSQLGIMFLGMLCPALANLIYLSHRSPFPNLDLTPFGYSLSGLILTWGVLRHKLFDVVPMARAQVLEDMAEGILVIDGQMRIVDANLAAIRLLHYPAVHTLIGQPARLELVERCGLPSGILAAPPARVDVAFGQGRNQRFLEVDISPVHGRSGLLLGRVIALRDVTERELARQSLQAAKAELEQDLIKREALIGDLEAFAHTVAHDLKGLLGVIMGYADMLNIEMQGPRDPQLDHYIQGQLQAVHKMDRIIDALLTLARVRQQDVTPSPLDTAAIIDEAEQRLAPLIAETGARITHPPAWPEALGHEAWVEEVWFNYISNACKYGGKPPCIELGAEAVPPGQVRFWVRDHGNGVRPEMQGLLFLEFSRAGQTRVRGYGLGLSIVKRIVEKLGGQVGMESSGLPGQGSTFYFTLPQAHLPDRTN